MTFSHLLRLFRTVRYLKGQQVWYQLKYRFFKSLSEAPNGYEDLINPDRPKETLATTTAYFRFLNQAHDFGSIENIDWNYPHFGKLWTYNLNYFDFIRTTAPAHSSKQSPETAILLIDDWIQKATAHKDAHEPYPTSLRIMNWLGFFSEQKIAIPPHVKQAIYLQYEDLWGKIEYHLMGNHLLENAIALVRAALYFNDTVRLKKALQLLAAQLKEQYLPEGAHYELSGAYHCTLLERLLTLFAVLQQHNTATAESSSSLATSLVTLQNSLERQLGWLVYLTDKNGYYPHFNDSVSGIAPSPKHLLQEGQHLGLPPKLPAKNLTPSHKHIQAGNFDTWLDLGPIGPNYIPGHGHADHLTFCLNFKGEPVVVDPAISTYEKNDRRQLERSTPHHNTVSIKAQDSSEVWGGFRCGRRAQTELLVNEPNRIVAHHNGYKRLGFRHQRTFHWSDTMFVVEDYCSGSAKAHLYFAPNINLIPQADGHWQVGLLQIHIEGGLAHQGSYQFANGFNDLLKAPCLTIDFNQQLKVTFRG